MKRSKKRSKRTSSVGAVSTEHKQSRKEAEDLVGSVEKALRKVGHKLSTKDAERVRVSLSSVKEALDSNDGRLSTSVTALKSNFDKYVRPKQKSTQREYIESVVVAVLIAALLRAFVIEAFKIPSGSMLPTLAIGDHIFVNKFIYGLRVPFTTTWMVQWGTPQRGDVIVFRYPPDPSIDFIKRVVAIAGDTVRMEDGVVFINGKQLETKQLVDYDVENENLGGRWPRKPFAFQESSSDGEISYRIVRESGRSLGMFPSPHSQFFFWDEIHVRKAAEEVGLECFTTEQKVGECKIKDGYVFVMGDNRDNSKDSRSWGAAPVSHVKGKALFVWGSWGESFDDFRFERLGRSIH